MGYGSKGRRGREPGENPRPTQKASRKKLRNPMSKGCCLGVFQISPGLAGVVGEDVEVSVPSASVYQ